ncbi:MAG: lactate racemase domain-containing protein [Alkalispirochaeta sp.]
MGEVMKWGGPAAHLTPGDIRSALAEIMTHFGSPRRILAVPPDFTRYHSYAGQITSIVYELMGERLTDVLPALGTHRPVSPREREIMFPGIPDSLFRVHDWRNDLATLGEVPIEFIRDQSEGKLDWPWPAQVNTLVATGGHDMVLSIGQVVPHEVVGMANHAKNLFVGTGGVDGINRSHFLGAVYGMERIMGRADNPVRAVLNYAAENFLGDIPVVYVLTVVGREGDELVVRGLFAGRGLECFYEAADLAMEVNFTLLDEAPEHVVAWLDPEEYHSTWLGNKSIYRSRMAIADGGRLTVLAPGVESFGEDPEIDRLIRKYGYRGTDHTLAAVNENEELRENLSAAAHLIHGSSEERFSITYAPGHITREEVEGVGFTYADLTETQKRYDPRSLRDGWNTLPDGERVYFLSAPGLGLWAQRDRFSRN